MSLDDTPHRCSGRLLQLSILSQEECAFSDSEGGYGLVCWVREWKLMTPYQKMHVQMSFAQVVPIAETAAALFYAKLFELDPTLRVMFKEDMAEQGRKLIQMLTVAVRGLDDLEALVPVVRALGLRHAGYGVRDAHYETVATALLSTLELGLGASFTDEVRDAWATVYWILADTMKAGAAGGTLARSA